MKKYEPRMEAVEYLESYICDRCGKEVDDTFDLQEAHSISFIGGYSSVFGDEAHIEADICQDCLLILIGSFCRIVN